MAIDRQKIVQLNGESPIDIRQASKYVGEIQKNGGGIKDVGGALGESLKKKFGIDARSEKNLNTLISKLDNFRKTDPIEKAKSVGEDSSKRLGGDKKLEDSIKKEAEKIIKGRNVKPKKDAARDLQESVAKSSGVKISDVEAKSIVEEMGAHEVKNIEEVKAFRKKQVTEIIEREYLVANSKLSKEELEKVTEETDKDYLIKNSTLDEDQLSAVRGQAKIVADVYYTGPGIENIKDEILAGVSAEGVDLDRVYSDLEGTIKLLKNATPEQIRAIQKDYAGFKEKLVGLNQPTNIRELSSFDSIMGALGNDGVMGDFLKGQNNIMGWADRINGWTGGAMGRVVADFGGKFISKIGNESVRNFAQNGLKMFAEKGFQQGFNAITKGLMSKGATFLATKLAPMVANLTALVPGIGTIIAVGIKALGIIKKVKDGIKKLGENIRNAFNNMVTSRGEDEDINKFFKKKWAWLVILLVFIMMGCVNQNGNISPMVPPVKDEQADYTGEHGVTVLQEGSNNFKVPTCDPDGKNPNGNNRLILREIALSVVGKVTYSGFNVWHQQGASPKWNTPVPQKWVKGKDKNGNSIMVLDMVHEKKRLMYPLYGLDCGGIAKWLWYQCMIDAYNKPNIGDWIYYSKREMYGLDEVHLESVEDLKIGDVFERTVPESKPMCLKKDKKTGEWYENGCHHFAIYIGKNEKGEPEVIEEVGNGGDPTLTTVTRVTPEYVTIDRDDQYGFKYYHVYRVTDIFKD